MITESQVASLFCRLDGLLGQYSEAVGVGEDGLDLITTTCCQKCCDYAGCRKWKLKGQRQFMQLAFQLAKHLDKVIVLHVGFWSTGEVAAEVLDLLRSIDLTNHKIQRHYFVGGKSTFSGVLPCPTVTLAFHL